MTARCKFILSYLIAFFTIYGCSTIDSGENKIHDSNTEQSSTAQKPEPKSSINIGGTYSFGENSEERPTGSLLVYPLTDTSAFIYFYVCNGPPAFGIGSLFAQISIEDSIGIYDSNLEENEINCILKFKFNNQLVKVETEPDHGECG